MAYFLTAADNWPPDAWEASGLCFTAHLDYGILRDMKAEPIIRYRQVYADGAIAEAVVWKVPSPVPPSEHDVKYRLYYGRGGKRLIGYDNERGKGDHRHIADREEKYEFVSIEKLMDDFTNEIAALRGGSDA